MKTIDAIISKTLSGIIDELRKLGIQKEDLFNIFIRPDGQYVAIFYS